MNSFVCIINQHLPSVCVFESYACCTASWLAMFVFVSVSCLGNVQHVCVWLIGGTNSVCCRLLEHMNMLRSRACNDDICAF